MEAGRELDCLVAERVMGWKPDSYGGRFWVDQQGNECAWAEESLDYYAPKDAWSPSTSIKDAWEVVEKLKREAVLQCQNGTWRVSFDWLDSDPFSSDLIEWTYADTAPLAICLAALKAVGVEL